MTKTAPKKPPKVKACWCGMLAHEDRRDFCRVCGELTARPHPHVEKDCLRNLARMTATKVACGDEPTELEAEALKLWPVGTHEISYRSWTTPENWNL